MTIEEFHSFMREDNERAAHIANLEVLEKLCGNTARALELREQRYQAINERWEAGKVQA